MIVRGVECGSGLSKLGDDRLSLERCDDRPPEQYGRPPPEQCGRPPPEQCGRPSLKQCNKPSLKQCNKPSPTHRDNARNATRITPTNNHYLTPRGSLAEACRPQIRGTRACSHRQSPCSRCNGRSGSGGRRGSRGPRDRHAIETDASFVLVPQSPLCGTVGKNAMT